MHNKIIAISLLFFRISLAQLSIEDCVQLSLHKNAAILSSGFSIQEATFRLDEIKAGRMPELGFSVGGSFASGLDPALTENGELKALMGLVKSIYNPSFRYSYAQGQANLLTAQQIKNKAINEIRSQVRQNYIELFFLNRKTVTTQASINDLNSYLLNVRSLASAGTVPYSDVIKTELQLQSETMGLQDLTTAAKIAARNLLALTGLPLDSTIALRDSIDLPPMPAKIAQNPDFLELEQRIKAAQLEIQLAHAEYYPNISFFAEAGGWTSRSQLIDNPDPDIWGYQAGISLDLPVFQGGAIAARIEQKKAQLNALTADYANLRRNTESEFLSTLDRYYSVKSNLAVLQSSKEKSQEQYQLLKSRYAAGAASSLELLDAHRTQLSVLLLEYDVLAAICQNQTQLLRLSGE
jgi:outer membrane protein TolC